MAALLSSGCAASMHVTLCRCMFVSVMAPSGFGCSLCAGIGNLVDMGKLAFAPATPEVLKLAAHLDRTHEFFGKSFYGVFRQVQPHPPLTLPYSSLRSKQCDLQGRKCCYCHNLIPWLIPAEQERERS